MSGNGLTLKHVKLSEIKTRGRFRKQLGDVQRLAASIQEVGLLQPLVLTDGNRLVAGGRRLKALRVLKWDTAPCVYADSLDDATDRILAERDENTCREPLTISESVAVAERLRGIYEKQAKAALREGGKKGGESKGGESFARLERDNSKRTNAKLAAGVGMSDRTLEKAKAVVESGNAELIAEMDRTGKVNGVHKRLTVKVKAEAIEAEPPPLPDGKYRVLVVDPPWHYDKRNTDPTHRGALPYPSMTLNEIASLDIGGRAEDDAVLWLWTTNSHIPHAFEIAAGWGFEYKTMLTWVKQKMGLGDWLRGKSEHCLLCVKGKPTVVLTNQTTVLQANAGKHSAKPDEFYEMIAALCPGSKIEFFARKKRDGWDGYGDEV